MKSVTDFSWMEPYAIVSPLGALVNACILACSAWLSAIARSWRGWTTYAALTALMMFPVTYLMVTTRMHPPGTHSGLGVGLFIVFTALPVALAWLLGLPIGLLCRLLGRSPT